MNRLGLFPLQIVLFPESVFPLHIFEERYKRLINNCLVNKQVFGINLSVSTKMYNIGCSAQILDIVQKDEKGNMDITVKGIRRYRLDEFEESENQYVEADVVYFDDIEEDLNHDLFERSIIEFNAIAEIVNSIKIEKLSKKEISTILPSFLVAQKAGLTLGQRQELLEMTSENQRLEYLLNHLIKIKPMLKEAEFVQMIIKNDGYLIPKV
jgi:Lon protease-like protein